MPRLSLEQTVALVVIIAAVALIVWHGRPGHSPTPDEACLHECVEVRNRVMARELEPGKPAPGYDWEREVSADCRPRCIALMSNRDQ